MTLNEVKELIELVAAKGFAEFEIARSDFKLKIVARAGAPAASAPSFDEPAPAPVIVPAPIAPTVPAVTSAPAAPEPAADEDLFVITSPIVGTFYRAPSPTAELFVKV